MARQSKTPKALKSKRFGRLVAQEKLDVPGRSRWLCLCDCGAQVPVLENQLLMGKTKSCGCLWRDTIATASLTHGESMDTSAEYRAWCAMRRRCNNPANVSFPDYGGRGIKVCERWSSFENFLEDMGRKPSASYTLDRKDPNGDYTPDNCKWSTRTDQARNKRNSHLVTYKGETKTLSAWYESGEIPAYILNRLRRGWAVERALRAAKGSWGTRANYSPRHDVLS